MHEDIELLVEELSPSPKKGVPNLNHPPFDVVEEPPKEAEDGPISNDPYEQSNEKTNKNDMLIQ